MIDAQIVCARLDGGVWRDETVVQIEERDEVVRVHSNTGSIDAERVLLCTGPYGTSLIEEDLPLELRLRTILLAELDPGPALPSLILHGSNNTEVDGVYWVPPTRYPNGRDLLKIGGNSLPLLTADSPSDLAAWFQSGGSQHEADVLLEVLRSLLPSRDIVWTGHKPCVVTYTPSGLPYIERISDRIAVTFGGCGSAAKSADEIGRLGAVCVTS